MLLNFSSSSNNSHSHPHLPWTDFDFFQRIHCFFSRPSSVIFGTYIIIKIILFLPLCIFIIYHGVQLWWKKRCPSSAVAISHSDIFIYHLVTMEMIGVFGCILNIWAINSAQTKMLTVGLFMLTFTFAGETFFHILTCVERYLAVVHPIIYLSLKKEKGVRLRNIMTGCVWLLCFVTMSVLQKTTVFVVLNFFFLVFSLLIISFCSVSVLCVLISPGPGKQGGSKERVDKSKLRAFYTIAGILGALVGRFIWDLIWAAFYVSEERLTCVMIAVNFWFNLPSGLVLPALFLHRLRCKM